MIISTRTFSGGMDHDSDDRLVEKGDYRFLVDGENDVPVKAGTIRNVKSGLLITNPYLEAGKNICIGYKEDVPEVSGIYMVWNENGFHGVFRYFRNKQGYQFGRVEKLMQCKYPGDYTPFHEHALNFNDAPEHLITGISLIDNFLFFTDMYSRAKFMDIDRANETEKRRKFFVFFNRINFLNPSVYTFNVYAAGNPVPVATMTYNTAVYSVTVTDYKTRIAAFVYYFKLSPLVNYFTVHDCGNHLEIEMVQEGEYVVTVNEVNVGITDGSVVVPSNFYPDKDAALPVGVSYDILSRDLIDELCYVPMLPPRVDYATDDTRIINLVKNRIFQFAARYQFFDNSWGVFGARSKIALPVEGCADTNNLGNINNYINVDFTDIRLENPALVSIIKRVELAVNQPGIDEVWKSVKIFEQYEIAGRRQAQSRFYNDGIYPAIATTTISKPFDAKFIINKSNAIGAGRKFDGGGIDGYDRPCGDMKVHITYQPPDVVSARFSITALLGIQNPQVGNNIDMFDQQPVIKRLNGTFQWGGVRDGGTQAQLQTGTGADAITNYHQSFDAGVGGFIGYLAGTTYYGVTKQIIPANLLQINTSVSALTLDPATGAIIETNSTDFNIQLWALLNHYMFVIQGPIEQRLVINNVPNGRYLVRIASHFTTVLELATGIKYQKTSTNAFIFGSPGQIYEWETLVNNGNTTVPVAFIVHDLCDLTHRNLAFSVYVVANDSLTPPVTVSDYMNETRVELSFLRVTFNTAADLPLGTTGAPNDRSAADHNGYIFGFFGVSFVYTIDSIHDVFSGQFIAVPASSINVFDGTPFAQVLPGFGPTYAVQITDAGIKNDGRTVLWGKVVNAVTGIGMPGVNVVTTHGSVYRPGLGSDNDGQYAIIIYPVTPQSGAGIAQRNGKIIFSAAGALCQFIFNNDVINGNVLLYGPAFALINIMATSPPDYKWGTAGVLNQAFWYPVQNMNAALTVFAQAKSGWKRGADWKFGVVYLDEGDRRCAVVTDDKLKLHSLFYTEQNGVNTGAAVIDWEVYNDPPDWAVKYAWVVTKNLQLTTYLQWCANKVSYVDEDDNGTTPGNAILVKINFDNIGFYTTVKHPDAVIAYTFQKGDRIRLIKDQNGNPYTDYYDFEIVKVGGGAGATDLYIYPLAALSSLSAGIFFEIYTPKGANANNLFFEFGETFEIKTGVFNGVLRKYHTGNATPIGNDQSYGPLPLQAVTPARGIFSSGDVYYRLRNIPINVPTAPPYVGLYAEKLVQIDDASVSDFYASRAPGFGRVHVDAPDIEEVSGFSAIRESNNYITDTQINGLRNYEALNKKSLSADYGLINILKIVDDTVLKALCANDVTVSMYVNKGVIKTLTSQVLISESDAILSSDLKNQRSFGTTDSGSAQLNDEGDLFYWCQNAATISRSSGNGLIPVSEYGLVSTFGKIAEQRRLIGYKNAKAVSTYHLGRDLYIVSFNPLNTFEGEKPFVKFKIPHFDNAITYLNPMMRVRVMPLNILLFTTTVADVNYPFAGRMIEADVNAGTAVHGFTAFLDQFGEVTIMVPLASNIYSNQELVIDLYYVHPTTGLNTSKTYNFNFSQAILPSVIDLSYKGETLAFCKKKNKWIQYYSWVPEYFGRIKHEIMSFVDGNLWLHEAGNDYGNYYGVHYNRRLTFVESGEKDIIKDKQFKCLEVNSKVIHYAPSLKIPANAQLPIGMLSELVKPHFILRNGKFYAAIQRDKNDPDPRFPTVNNKWINGRPMEGQVLEVLLENDSLELAELLEAQVGYVYIEVS